ncbi:hypothetical protein Lste_3153 [Legionella steelei]|uniref:Secreted protein n=1 Tax=Legionella steelei TaxID=947033 RepID=A0A0W0ZDU2_9GAMM|nr:hypothetical protein [Legionella steelei]KTD66947.1 hypothetical protein Lste_3153 [Legionella steelei]
MVKILMYLGLVLSSNLLIAQPGVQSGANNVISCGSMNEIERVGKQIKEFLQREFCETTIDPKKLAPISQNVLQKIMTTSFLGVAPPQNWQQLTDDMINNCLKNNNLCKKEARKEFEACMKQRVPFILLQFGPWVAENCSQLNKSLIQKWSDKKAILKKIIDESKVDNNVGLP